MSTPRDYKLVPVTAEPLPAPVEKLLRRSVKLREQAGELFGQSAALLQKAVEATYGAKKRRAIEPGTVYKLRTPLPTGKGVKSTIQIVDNFAQHEVCKVTRVPRFDLKMWKGDGPVADRPARDAGKAQPFTQEDELP